MSRRPTRGSLLWTALRHPLWFLDVWRAADGYRRGIHDDLSLENALKLAANKHNVDYHRFG